MGELQFKLWEFVVNLKYMLSGMLGIFIVIGLIILSVFLLNYFTSPKKEKDENPKE